jgi:hypothetical protein
MENPVEASFVPAQLSFFRGGLCVGIFYPGPPVSPSGSLVLGNLLTGQAQEYRASGDGVGESRYAWALILAPADIKNFVTNAIPNTVITEETSVYDGYYNKSKYNENQIRRLNQYTPGGYKDWYIPSRDELGFIAKNLPYNFDPDFRFSPMIETEYLTSTYVQQNVGNDTKKISLLLAQSFDLPTYGDTLLVSDTKAMAIRLVRKVPVNII